MSFTDSDYLYFVHTFDTASWEDREPVKTLIEMYRSHGCLCDMKNKDY